ncbi:FeoA family protein [Desulfobulbus propionicus]|jgi:Fe2+ transport system protein FeoA
MRFRHGMSGVQYSQSQGFPLSLAGEGERVQVLLFPQGSKIQERLMSMGISLHDVVTVVQKQHGGALMIEKDGTRYALGGGMAHKILVVKLE